MYTITNVDFDAGDAHLDISGVDKLFYFQWNAQAEPTVEDAITFFNWDCFHESKEALELLSKLGY